MLTQAQQKALSMPQSIGVRCADFQPGRQIPREYTGHGDDVSPPLAFTGIPERTQALALVVDDPDAPGGTFTHWTVWNLPPGLRHLERATDPLVIGAREGRNDFGTSRYRGPKPPSGTHRYYFRVFALDQQLALPPSASAEEVWRHLSGHTVAWGELMGTFTKP